MNYAAYTVRLHIFLLADLTSSRVTTATAVTALIVRYHRLRYCLRRNACQKLPIIVCSTFDRDRTLILLFYNSHNGLCNIANCLYICDNCNVINSINDMDCIIILATRENAMVTYFGCE